MAVFDLKKKLAESAQAMKSGMDSLQSSVKNINVAEAVQTAKDRSSNAVDFLKQKTDQAKTMISDAVAKPVEIDGYITTQGAMQLIYLIMAADGEIRDEETSQYMEIGVEADPKFPEYAESLMASCKNTVAEFDEEDFSDDIRDCAQKIIHSSMNIKGAVIPVKLLVWNLLAMSLSDNDLSEKEGSLIRYMAKHMNVDKSIVPEMEHAIRAVMAIEEETRWLKASKRSFGEVEAALNELADRKMTIMQGVHALINE